MLKKSFHAPQREDSQEYLPLAPIHQCSANKHEAKDPFHIISDCERRRSKSVLSADRFLILLSDFPPFRRTAAETRPFHYPQGRSAPRFRLGGAISPPYHVCDTFFSASHFPPNLNLWRTVTVTYPSPPSVTEKSAVKNPRFVSSLARLKFSVIISLAYP